MKIVFFYVNSELDVWCDLTFMLRGGNADSVYKNITIPDDNIVNPWRGLHLSLKSSDQRVEVQENCSYAVIWVKDNDSSQTTGNTQLLCPFLKV